MSASLAAAPLASSSAPASASDVMLLDDGWAVLSAQGVERAFALAAADNSNNNGGGAETTTSGGFSRAESVALYTLCYQLCTQRAPHAYAPQLYDRLAAALDAHLAHRVAPQVAAAAGPAELLAALVTRWRQHQRASVSLGLVFQYLDRYYVQRYRRLPLAELCVDRWAQLVLQPLVPRVTAAIVALATQLPVAAPLLAAAGSAPGSPGSPGAGSDRCDLPPAALASLLRDAVAVHVAVDAARLRVYREGVEIPLVARVAALAGQLSQAWLLPGAVAGTAEYLARADAALAAARALAREVCRPAAERVMHTAAADALLIKPRAAVFALAPQQQHQQPQQTGPLAGAAAAFAARDEATLKLLHTHYAGNAAALAALADAFRAHVAADVKAALALAAAPPSAEAAAAIAAAPTPAAAAAATAAATSASLARVVPALLRAAKQAQATVDACFAGNAALARTLRDELARLRGAKVTTSAEESAGGAGIAVADLLVAHADSLLRKPAAPAAAAALPADASAQLDVVAALVPVACDAEAFMEGYAKAQAKRLLLERSAGLDAEAAMVARLQARVGGLAQACEVQLADARNAPQAQAAFAEWLAKDRVERALPPAPTAAAAGPNADDGQLRGVALSVLTLTETFWPLDALPQSAALPEPLRACASTYERFYASVTRSRVLKWVHSMGSAVLSTTAMNGGAPLEIVASGLQAACLLVFNKHKEMTVAGITAELALSPDAAKLLLRSLVSGPLPLVVKEPAAGYAPSHVLRINTAFRTQHRRVRVPPALAAPAAGAAGSSAAGGAGGASAAGASAASGAGGELSESSRFALDAAIVRVLKAKKKIKHEKLLVEAAAAVPFPVTAAHIKSRVQALIQRDYLERDSMQPDVYYYVA